LLLLLLLQRRLGRRHARFVSLHLTQQLSV
jgi:hypothetical protein